MHNNRDDFLANTKTRLAERAGYKCCYLGCGQSTIGPSEEENNTQRNSTGVAAHIYAAANGRGARRTAPRDMTSEQKKDLSNGIWMCGTHADYIDGDEVTFTAEILKRWKQIGEQIAQKMQESRCSYIRALTGLESEDPDVTRLLLEAQQYDPTPDRTETLDLLLYRNIKDLILPVVYPVARDQGYVTGGYNTSESRDPLDNYIDNLNRHPVEWEFINPELQELKEKFDSSARSLSDVLGRYTFYEKEEGVVRYKMSFELGMRNWQELDRQVNEIQDNCLDFVQAFDNLHRACRIKFAE